MKKRHEIIEFRDISNYSELPTVYVEQIADCVQSAFGGGVTKEDTLNHMQGEQILLGLHKQNDGTTSVVGFSATSISDGNTSQYEAPERHAYFAAAAISREYQGAGLYAEMNAHRLDFVQENKLDTIMTRTQNPRVEEGISRALEKLVEMRQIRLFTIARQVVQGAYGGMLTRDKPVAKTVFYDNIDYERGDANLITWRLLP